MKTSVKIWIAVLLVAALLLAVGACFVLRHAFKTTEKTDKSGWAVRAGAICYLDKDGNPLLGWQEIEGKKYYFVPDAGIRATGRIQIGTDLYYFDENGVAMTGWQEFDGRKCYLDESGKLVRGLYIVDGAGYFFQDNGAMATGWQNVDGIPCYFDETGKALPGWQKIDGVRYFFKESGEVMVGWNTIGENLYYFTEEGKRLSGWQTIEDKGYYFTNEGYVVTGWLELDGEKYYCKENGEMAVGKVEIDGVNHFFTSKGKYVLLVNKENPVPEDFTLNLVSYAGYQVDGNAKPALEEMRKACAYATKIDNIFRSKALQQQVWDNGVRNRMKQGMTKEEAEAETAKWAMPAGHSEHQTGLAVDLFGSDEARKWLEEHCWEYGFIVRYPEGKAEFTGIDYEYWHFRYVGIELALELKELGMCLEEYMQMLSQ